MDNGYWILDIPGLTEADARRLAEAARQITGYDDIEPLSPREWFPMLFAKDGVEFMMRVFRASLAAEELHDPEERETAALLCEDMSEWLELANQEDSD